MTAVCADGGGGVVGEIEVAREAEASGVLGAEVDLGGGEAEGCGLRVAGEEDGCRSRWSSWTGRGRRWLGSLEAVKARVMWQVAPGARSFAGAGGGAVAGLLGEAGELVAAGGEGLALLC